MNCKHFGILLEYQMILYAIICYFSIYLVVSYIPAVSDTYYEYLIDFIAKWVLMSAYYVWLALYLQRFAAENIGYYSAISGEAWTSRIMGSATFSDKQSNIEIDSTPLHKILSNEKQHKLFRNHVQETMCPENLLFFC